MRIQDSSILMGSNRYFAQSYEKRVKLDFWVGDRSQQGVSQNPHVSQVRDDARAYFSFISEQAKAVLSAKDNTLMPCPGCSKEDDPLEGAGDSATIIKKLLIEAFTGRKITILKVERLNEEDIKVSAPADAAPNQAPERQGWGLIYDSHESYKETEQTVFAAEGIVRTKDGKEIAFKAVINMQREFAHSEDFTLRAGDAKKIDPLIINFSGNAASLTSAKFSFDLDSDGNGDKISFAGNGSGFLVLDLNNDGKATNGTELFGPSTGNGMAELSAYDSDKNSWIDEQDPVYADLLVWTKDETGADKLAGLKASGVGAIYLGSADTAFSIKDSANNLIAQVASTGIFLKEDGGAGAIQQLDLVV
ncbi:MAG: VCBS repeat-containing protein [Deltaproteobacteria bacterium]|nr:VCBS repeat-containing protein [Deltaproteobacteria bacterium]